MAALGLAGCARLRTAIGGAGPTFPADGDPGRADVDTTAVTRHLAGVLSRLADTSIPAEQKVGLVQYATVDDQPVLGNFGEALEDSGFVPVVVTATDLTWSPQPGNVLANVTIGHCGPGREAVHLPDGVHPGARFLAAHPAHRRADSADGRVGRAATDAEPDELTIA